MVGRTRARTRVARRLRSRYSAHLGSSPGCCARDRSASRATHDVSCRVCRSPSWWLRCRYRTPVRGSHASCGRASWNLNRPRAIRGDVVARRPFARVQCGSRPRSTGRANTDSRGHRSNAGPRRRGGDIAPRTRFVCNGRMGGRGRATLVARSTDFRWRSAWWAAVAARTRSVHCDGRSGSAWHRRGLARGERGDSLRR